MGIGKELTAAVVGLGLTVGCSPAANPIQPTKERSPGKPPATAPLPSTIPTVILPPPPTKEIASLPQFLEHDLEIKRIIEQAKERERLILEKVLIEHITRSTVGGEHYFATLDTVDAEGKTRLVATLLNASCIFDALQKGNQLGTSTNIVIGRTWKPVARVDRIIVEVSQSSGVPILSTKEITHAGITRSCK